VENFKDLKDWVTFLFNGIYHPWTLASLAATVFILMIWHLWPLNASAACGFVFGYVLFYAIRHTDKLSDAVPLLGAMAAILGGGFLPGYINKVEVKAPVKEDVFRVTTSELISSPGWVIGGLMTNGSAKATQEMPKDNIEYYGEGIVLGFAFYFVVASGIVAVWYNKKQIEAASLAKLLLGAGPNDFPDTTVGGAHAGSGVPASGGASK
jgi:hypothetical protein